jgi:hypothetical protein
MSDILVALGLAALILASEGVVLCIFRVGLGALAWVANRLGVPLVSDRVARSNRLWAVAAVLTAGMVLYKEMPQFSWYRPTIILVWILPTAILLGSVALWTRRRTKRSRASPAAGSSG